jgi:hypothetical protein
MCRFRPFSRIFKKNEKKIQKKLNSASLRPLTISDEKDQRRA